MKFACLVALLSFCLPALLSAETTARSVSRPNVLFIMADDLNADLGTYGHSLVQSPNIDELARNGLQFNSAYVQYPVCAPSRASMMTGLYPEQIGVIGIGSNFRDNVPKVTTLPQLFRSNGYFSARIGKIYHYNVPSQIGTNGQDDAESWDQVINPIGIDKDVEKRVNTIRPDYKGDIGGTLTWLNLPSRDEQHTDGKITAAAIDLLHERHPNKTGQPFFLAVGFFRPHVPLIAPSKYFDLYPLSKIHPVEEPDNDRDDVPVAALADRPSQAAMTVQQKKEVIQAYYANISFVDAQVGRLLRELTALDLADNTIVVFLSDHGFHLGRHGLWQKGDLFEGSARSPLIISVPGQRNKGETTHSLVEFVDIYPTLAGLAGLSAPDFLAGVSLQPLFDRPDAVVRNSAFSMALSTAWWTRPHLKTQEIMGYTIRTENYRYTEWADGHSGVEIYHYPTDPNEYHNLLNVRELATIRLRLGRELEYRKPMVSERLPQLEDSATRENRLDDL